MLRECVVADGVRVPGDSRGTGFSLRVAQGDLVAGEREYDGLGDATCERERAGGLPPSTVASS
jgi:hypothetical protein